MKTLEEVKKEYQESLLELSRLEAIFDKKPCTKTATPLAAYRNVVKANKMAVRNHPESRKVEEMKFAALANDIAESLGMERNIRYQEYFKTLTSF